MKQKLLPKQLLAGLIALSLFSAVYVNVHAAYTAQTALKNGMAPQPVLVEEEDKDKSELPVPDVTVIARIIDLVEKFASANH